MAIKYGRPHRITVRFTPVEAPARRPTGSI